MAQSGPESLQEPTLCLWCSDAHRLYLGTIPRVFLSSLKGCWFVQELGGTRLIVGSRLLAGLRWLSLRRVDTGLLPPQQCWPRSDSAWNRPLHAVWSSQRPGPSVVCPGALAGGDLQWLELLWAPGSLCRQKPWKGAG